MIMVPSPRRRAFGLLPVAVVALAILPSSVIAFTPTTTTTTTNIKSPTSSFQESYLFGRHRTDLLASASAAAATPAPTTPGKKTIQQLRKEGGPLTFNTPIGALNPFGIYYGLTSIFLGLFWYVALKACQLFYFVTRGKIDKKRLVPNLLDQAWGVALMRLTRSYPKMHNLDILEKFYKESKTPAMFVANHCSWMDIPFLGASIGWRNYKLISKKELERVPILGAAIKIGANIMIDRTDRRSQIKTLKDGINYLKTGVHLCTFPEGTRSRTGRLLPFKNGAFKMAHKAGAPVIPVSIINSHIVMPTGWMFPNRPSHGTAQVVIHEPVESVGRTEAELAAEVERRMQNGLPEYQHAPIVKEIKTKEPKKETSDKE